MRYKPEGLIRDALYIIYLFKKGMVSEQQLKLVSEASDKWPYFKDLINIVLGDEDDAIKKYIG